MCVKMWVHMHRMGSAHMRAQCARRGHARTCAAQQDSANLGCAVSAHCATARAVSGAANLASQCLAHVRGAAPRTRGAGACCALLTWIGAFRIDHDPIACHCAANVACDHMHAARMVMHGM